MQTWLGTYRDSSMDFPETCRVLSFCQPYASLVVAGRKCCENRTRPTNHRCVLLVHASSHMEQEGVEYLSDELNAAGLDPKNLSTSAIIGTVVEPSHP